MESALRKEKAKRNQHANNGF